MSANPVANNVLVELLGSALRYGGEALTDVPELVKRVLKEESWQVFRTRLGDEMAYGKGEFPAFASAMPPLGLGASVELLKNVCRSDMEALALIDEACRQSNGTNQHTRGFVESTNPPPPAPTGDSTDYALRRLRKDRPDLLQEVINGTMTAHAAMKEAGLRHRRVSVDVEDADSAARTLRNAMTREVLRDLVILLGREVEDHA